MENRKSNMEEEHVPAGEAPEGTRPVESGDIPIEGTKPEKRLSEEEILRRRKYIVIPAFVLVFLAVLCLIFAPSGGSGETVAGGSGFNVNVPEPTTVQLEGNKTDVYERQQARQEKDRRMQSLSDLAGRLLEGKKGADSIPSPDGSIRQSADTYEQIAGQLESFYETPQATTGTLEQKVEELSRRLEETEAENRRTGSREEMMEQSYRMAARYLNPKPEATPDEVEEEKPEPVPVSRVESGTTSVLEQPLTDSALVASLAAERNYGFNTAVGSSYRMGMNTIPACISESQTLEQGGRVKLRLLAPLQAGSVTVPANSLVTGTADIRGERLDILVSSIEYAGNIIPVQLATYDIDGQRGIFVPGSESRTAAKEVLGDVSQSMGGSISFAGSAGQQVAMDLTRGVLQGGTRFISQRVKAVKVKLKAGYKVLLVTKKQ